MTIDVNDLQNKYGTLTDLANASGAVSIDSFSAQTDLLPWENTGDLPTAGIVGLFTFTTAPSAVSPLLLLYARPLDIATGGDADIPSASVQREYLGSFSLAPRTGLQRIGLVVSLLALKSAQEFELYIENKSKETLPAGWSLQITPTTVGPKSA